MMKWLPVWRIDSNHLKKMEGSDSFWGTKDGLPSSESVEGVPTYIDTATGETVGN